MTSRLGSAHEIGLTQALASLTMVLPPPTPTATCGAGRRMLWSTPGAVGRLGWWLSSSRLAESLVVLSGLYQRGCDLLAPMGPPSGPTLRRERGSTRSWDTSQPRRPQSWGWQSRRSWGWTGTEEHIFSTHSSPSQSVPMTQRDGYSAAAGSSLQRGFLPSQRSRWPPLQHCAPSALCPGRTTGCT